MRLKTAVKYKMKPNNAYAKLIVAVIVTTLKPQIHLYSAK
jgi:hypothetical protein